MKIKYTILIMIVYVLLLIFGIIYGNNLLLNLSTALAVFSSGVIQYSDSKKSQDEREKFINERAQSKAFIVMMAVILFSYFGSDAFDLIKNVSSALIFEVLFGIGFMSFTTMYIYLSR